MGRACCGSARTSPRQGAVHCDAQSLSGHDRGTRADTSELVGGSADLAGSNLTLWSGSRAITRNSGGNYLHYGVREFGMAAIMNGIALHGGFIPYGGHLPDLLRLLP